MSYDERRGSQSVSGWVGWIVFAACLMIVNGAFTAIQGLAGIFRDEEYFLRGGGEALVLDFTAWGWIHLILGIALILIGLSLFRGSLGGRIAGLVVVVFNLVAQFTWIGVYPWWSLVAITLGVLVLYALIVHGGELDQRA